MMKGNNKITLNQATMVEAMQLWVDSNFQEGKAPTVDCVEYDHDGGMSGAKVFVVNFSDKDRPGPTPG